MVTSKAFSFLIKMISMPLYLFVIPIVLLSRISRPLIQIRFGPIGNHVLGHFSFDTEYYLTDMDISRSKTVDFFYFRSSQSANEQWEIMVKRKMRVHPLTAYLDKANRCIPGWEAHYARLVHEGIPLSGRDPRGLLRNSKIQMSFTKEENERGRSFLEQIGMGPDQHFVCIIARDSGYKDKYMTKWGKKRDWSYHNYRDSDINNYSKTAHALAQHNYFVFRLGKGVNESLKTKHDNVIDYATSEFRSDFLDIFLSRYCRFFINGESGLSSVPNLFRVPIVFVNLAAIEYVFSWNSNIISIPKKYWLSNEKRFMTFKEIFECGAGRFGRTDQYEKLGIELIENTPDEILDVTMEMHQMLNGTWKTSEEDEVLQERFWEMLPKSELHGELRGRIGAEFLKQNSALLD